MPSRPAAGTTAIRSACQPDRRQRAGGMNRGGAPPAPLRRLGSGPSPAQKQGAVQTVSDGVAYRRGGGRRTVRRRPRRPFRAGRATRPGQDRRPAAIFC
jgi:hypothetical protein